jgi:hypothetical protein
MVIVPSPQRLARQPVPKNQVQRGGVGDMLNLLDLRHVRIQRRCAQAEAIARRRRA